MSERLCGYCRQLGHTKNKCEVRLGQIDLIRRHVGEQRTLAQKILLANGVGVGAIVTATDYWTGAEVPCLVPSLQIWDSHVDWKIVKYKKQVRATLGVYSSVKPESKYDGLIRYATKNKIGIPVYKLDDMSNTLTAYFFLDMLENKSSAAPVRTWDYNKHSTILSPSNETDVGLDSLLAPFSMHERLTLNKEKSNMVTPILP